MTLLLHPLLHQVGLEVPEALPNCELTGLSCDSRRVGGGTLFVGLPGTQVDGGSFWPQALQEGRAVNMRMLTNDPMPNVVSYVVDEPLGWATASSPTHNLVLGYIWQTKEYPWFNAWRHVDDNKRPLARGLEFGTTGLHQPFGVLIEKGTIFGRKLVTYLDAGQSTTRSYIAFLAKTPANWQGVQNITYKDGVITLTERGTRTIDIPSGPLF